MLQVELEFGGLGFFCQYALFKLFGIGLFVKILNVTKGKVHYPITYIIYYVMFKEKLQGEEENDDLPPLLQV